MVLHLKISKYQNLVKRRKTVLGLERMQVAKFNLIILFPTIPLDPGDSKHVVTAKQVTPLWLGVSVAGSKT